MAPRGASEELFDEEPPAIDPYTVLGVSKTATADEVKSAYRKAALKHHPDKVGSEHKDTAHTKFQELVCAYGILSDASRRARYDATGSTSESLDGADFSWADFYKTEVTADAIRKIAEEYKGSIEEKDAVLNAYRKGKGKWSLIYSTVMLSDPLDDEDRFREIIEEGIEKGEVEAYKAYREEGQGKKEKRMRAARKEAKEAEEYAEELGVKDQLFSGKGKAKEKKGDGEDSLAALIKSRQAGRSSFMDQLEAKYGAEEKKTGKGKKGKKRATEDSEDIAGGEMPTEEEFQAAAERVSGGRKAKKAKR